jgi:hypothetical protein
MTYSNFRKHLLQSWFNESYKGLKEQGKKSNDSTSCYYNLKTDSEVLHCGVGHLLKNVPIPYSLNCKVIGALIRLDSNVRKELLNPTEEETEFLIRLQYCHDRISVDSIDNDSFFLQLNKEYSRLAENYDLNTEVITE